MQQVEEGIWEGGCIISMASPGLWYSRPVAPKVRGSGPLVSKPVRCGNKILDFLLSHSFKIPTLGMLSSSQTILLKWNIYRNADIYMYQACCALYMVVNSFNSYNSAVKSV